MLKMSHAKPRRYVGSPMRLLYFALLNRYSASNLIEALRMTVDTLLTLAETIRRFYGFPKTLLVEQEAGQLSQQLRAQGLPTSIGRIEPVVNRISTTSGELDEQVFDLVILNQVIDSRDDDSIRQAVESLFVHTTKYAILIIGETGDELDTNCDTEKLTRSYWESVCFQAGFRKHSAYYAFNEYSSLQSERYPIVIPLEKIPAEALEHYPLTVLSDERSLHMDMMREAGSRSDAHIIRYVFAAQHIRPGDRVLDAACGPGYGAHVLSQTSLATHVRGVDASNFSVDYANLNYGRKGKVDFICGYLPDCLQSLPDNSCDVVVTFETLEHLADAKPTLEAFKRVLTPGGRIIASVPNDWTDETGKDPNPYHLQVYTLPKFLSDIGAFFEVETLHSQTSDRIKKPGGAPGEFVARPRAITSISLSDSEQPVEAEWLLVVASKDVKGGEQVPFADRMFSEEERLSAGAALAVGRHYDNPWIFRSLVSIGVRIDNRHVRRELASKVLDTARPGSADQGACLCIMAYLNLESSNASLDSDLIKEIDGYIDRLDPETETVIRWQTSLAFVRAQMALQAGDMLAAEMFFLKVLSAPITDYSVTLLTKSVDASFRLGCIYLAQGLPDRTREVWKRYYASIKRDIAAYLSSSTENTPATFELNEIGEVLSRLSRLTGGLKMLEQLTERPFAFSSETTRDTTSQRLILERYVGTLMDAREWLLQDIKATAVICDAKDSWARQLIEARDWWHGQWETAQKHLAEQSSWIESLTEAKSWIEGQWKAATDATEERDKLISDLSGENGGQ